MRATLADSFQLFAGAGVGLYTRIGVPDVRVLAGLRFAPRDRDRDDDGVEDNNDQCAEVAEGIVRIPGELARRDLLLDLLEDGLEASGTRTDFTDSPRAMSLSSEEIWLTLTPAAGSTSKRVMTGPG